MAVTGKDKDLFREVAIPTDSNRDAGIFLLFLGSIASWPLTYLIARLALHRREVNYIYALIACIILVCLGIYLMFGSKKVFRIYPHENKMVIKDGLLTPPLTYIWKHPPAIRLLSVEEIRRGQPIEVWLVNLVEGKIQYTLDRRARQQMASRTLAEMLAKAIGCPVIESLEHGDTLVIAKEDLDLPFRERVRKYPALLGQRYEQPPDCSVKLITEPDLEIYSWDLKNTGLLLEAAVIFMFLLGLALVPWQVGRRKISMLDLALYEGQYLYFLVIFAIALLTILIIFGYRSVLKATPEQLCSHDYLWGIPVQKRCIPTDKLEEISARTTSRGAYVQLVSDEKIISIRLSCEGSAPWVAYRLRRFYAPDELEEAPQTVEMQLPPDIGPSREE